MAMTKMACSTSFSFGTVEKNTSSSPQKKMDSQASGAEVDEGPRPATVRQRRHSHFLPRRKSMINQMGAFVADTEEGLLLKVDLFLGELESRLDFLERYGDVASSLDSSISRAFATLQAVRTRSSQVSEEMFGAGRRRLHVMVDTLEGRCQGALAAAGSLNEKAKVGVEMLDGMLTEFEKRANRLRRQGLGGAASNLVDEGRRVVDESLGHARDVMHDVSGRALRAAETMEAEIQRAIGRVREHGLLRYEDLPEPWRVNPHILSGYRFSESKLAAVRSAFWPSNELINIWSHGLGSVLVLGLALYVYPTSSSFSLSTTADMAVAAVFFFAACQCLVCSTIWHTMSGIADVGLVSVFACVDYTGISLLIAATIMTSEYTAFYCEPVSRAMYMTTTAVLGIGGLVLPWHPAFNGNEMAWLRVAFFVGLAATGFLPVLQIAVTRGLDHVTAAYGPVIKSVSLYLLGAFVYAGKVPERFCPGMFDYVGGSHNLWHLAVVGGIVFHYFAMQDFFAGAFQRARNGCPAQ